MSHHWCHVINNPALSLRGCSTTLHMQINLLSLSSTSQLVKAAVPWGSDRLNNPRAVIGVYLSSSLETRDFNQKAVVTKRAAAGPRSVNQHRDFTTPAVSTFATPLLSLILVINCATAVVTYTCEIFNIITVTFDTLNVISYLYF